MISQFSVKKSMTVFVCVVLVIMLGAISFMNMTTDLLPSMDLPYVVAYTTYVGASPEQVEQGVTKTLESALATTSGVKNITSVSQENVSMLILEFEQETNMDSAMIEMTGSIDQVTGYLPEGVGSPILMKINPDMLPIMVLAVDRDDTEMLSLSAFAQGTVIPALERVDGVASVSGNGLVESQLRILLDQDKIDALNDKILASVDSSLAEAQQKLKDAKKEIEDGKKKLESESGLAYNKLVDAAQQLNEAQIKALAGSATAGMQVNALQSSINELETRRAALVSFGADYNANDSAVQTTLGTAKYAQLKNYQAQRLAEMQIIATAQQQKSAAEASVAEIDSRYPSLAADLAIAERDFAAADAAYDAAAAANGAVQAKKDALDLAAAAAAASRKTVENLQIQIADLQNQITIKKAYGEDTTALEAELAAAQQKLPAAEADRDAAAAAEAEALSAYNDAVSQNGDLTLLGQERDAKRAYLAELQTAYSSRADAVSAASAAATAVQSAGAQLAAIEKKMLALAGSSSAAQSMVQTWINNQDALAGYGYTDISEVTAMIATLDQLLQKAKTELATAQATQSGLSQTSDKLSDAQKKTEAGKLTAMSEIIKATIKLEDAETSVNEAEKEFKTQRDAAYKAAGIDGILTQSTISQLLKAQNFSMPAGYITSNGQKNTVKVGEKFADIEELKNWVLFSYNTGNIGDIRLSDLAEVTLLDNSEELYAKINGNDGVILSIQKSSIASTSAACKNLYSAMEKLQEQYPGLHLTALSDQGQYIDLVVSSVLENLMFGALLAVIVLLFFLKDYRPTLIVALSIPISLMLAVVLMYFTGVTLNIISLSGLALGVGMLVDNSIVAIENIYRLRLMGYNAATAAVHGCRQIAGAITASTLTTVCVFAPILFAQGLTRQLFSDMGLTIAYSLGASLLVALTLVPAMSGKMLAGQHEVKENHFLTRLIQKYEKALRYVLEHKAPVLIGAVALLIASGVLVMTMGTAFLPDMDSPQVSVSLTMPEGATQQETREMSGKVLERILTVDGVQTVGAMEGGGIMSQGDGISMYVLLGENRSRSSQQIALDIEHAAQDLACTVTANGSTMDMASMMGGTGIQVSVTGNDLDELRRIGSDISGILLGIEGIDTVSDGQEDSGGETRITVDKTRATEYGLTVAQVYQQVAAALTAETNATNIAIDNVDVPVIVVPSEKNKTTRENLESLILTGKKENEDCEVKLSAIAAVEDTVGQNAIRRENQTRTFTVSATLAEGYNIGKVSKSVSAALDSYEVPAGYACTVGGENETINSTIGDLITMILLAVALIYFIMVAQFQSLLSPFIVLFTIPLAFTGGLLALWITGKEISVIAMLGFLVLSGVIVNNGIVFVDYTNQLRLEGMDKREALIKTGCDRIRPILMTALTTIFGLVTMAMGLGSGGDMLQPLAIVTIGGLTYATFLTLFIVPSMYDILHRKPMKKVTIEEVSDL